MGETRKVSCSGSPFTCWREAGKQAGPRMETGQEQTNLYMCQEGDSGRRPWEG